MLIEELFAAIHEKEQVLQTVRAEGQRLETEIETLRAAIKILEREPHGPRAVEPITAPAVRAPETIRKAFP
jgi:hypothetical protein